jgi:hypothetical protein
MRWPDEPGVWRDAPPAVGAPAPTATANGSTASPERSVRPRALEDVIDGAMPAVVRVHAGDNRGAGFFVRPDTVLTNAHVVGSRTYVTVALANGASVPSRVVTRRDDLDLAVIRTSSTASSQVTLPLASGLVRPGQEVVAIGSPLGLQNTVTRGIVSALRRSGPVVLVQTDAAINPGNSGGPILDRRGQVIAIATLKVGGRAEALGFGVAAEHAVALLEGRAGAEGAALAPAGAATDLEPDRDRSDAAAGYEQFMAQAARRADKLDESWDEFVPDCLSGRAPSARGDRAWFVLWERFDTSTVSPACTRFYANFQAAAVDFQRAMAQANDQARQQGVYPGVCREIRRRYRLDSPDW